MPECRLPGAFQLGDDPCCQHLAQLDAPLVEESMFQIAPCVKTLCSYSATSLPRVSGVSRSTRMVFVGRLPSQDAVRHQPVRRALGPDLVLRLAEGQRFGLGEQVRHQQVVMAAERVQGLAETDEIARDQLGPLVDELVEGMLAVGAGLAPDRRVRSDS